MDEPPAQLPCTVPFLSPGPLGAQHFRPCAAGGWKGLVSFCRKLSEFFLCESSPLSGYMSSKRSFTPELHQRSLSMQSSVIFRFVPINCSLSVYLLSREFPLASSLLSGEDKMKSYATALPRFSLYQWREARRTVLSVLCNR